MIGAKAEILGNATIFQKVMQYAPEAVGHILGLTGKTTLRQMAAILKVSDLLVCVDSGPMHIAASLDVPLVTLFGPGDPVRFAPFMPRERYAIVRVGLACSPCRQHNQAGCPSGFKCMAEISIDDVLAAVLELKNRYAGRQLA